MHEEHASGADCTRPVLARLLLLRDIRAGEALVVVRLDRLVHSVAYLLPVIEQLEAKGAHFRSLHDPIDTATPQGMFSLQVLGVVAQLERALIAERAKAGLRAAKASGQGARTGQRQPRPAGLGPGHHAQGTLGARRRLSRCPARRHGRLAAHRVPDRMRPEQPWGDVMRVLNCNGAQQWTVEGLRRTVHRLAAEGIVEQGCSAGHRPSPATTAWSGSPAALQLRRLA